MILAPNEDELAFERWQKPLVGVHRSFPEVGRVDPRDSASGGEQDDARANQQNPAPISSGRALT